MTLDQVCMLLVERKSLLNRERNVQPNTATALADKWGNIKGRAADGTPITGRIAGKSKARQLMEVAAERRKKK